jgi:multiple antibiotic resistance protein
MLTSEEGGAIGVIPLGIPMIFGAGLFTTVIILRQQAQGWGEIGIMIAAYCINAIAIYLALRYAVDLRRVLGETAEGVVTRLMGLITGAIAIQFIVGGAVALAKHYF